MTPKNRHLGTIAQLFRAISLQLRHVSTVGKKNLLNSNTSRMSSQYGKLRPTSDWDCFVSLGHPSKFQRLSCLGSVTARHCSSLRQPNFAALNRGRHLYSAGWLSCWALAHIVTILTVFAVCITEVFRLTYRQRRTTTSPHIVKWCMKLRRRSVHCRSALLKYRTNCPHTSHWLSLPRVSATFRHLNRPNLNRLIHCLNFSLT